MKHTRRNFLKKTASLSAIAALSPVAGIGQDFSLSAKDYVKLFIFLTKPYLQNPTKNSMTVMWIVNLPSFSYVEYGKTADLGKIAKSVESGLVVAYNRVNSVNLSGLKPDTKYYYRIVSKEITKFDPYKIEYGKTIKSDIYSFATPNPNLEKVSMLIFNDMHDRPRTIPHMMKFIEKRSTDLVFFNGDILGHIDDEKQIIDHFIKTCGEEFATQIPFYFVRGNHETRGDYARNLHQYFTTPKNKQYYDFVWGSTHFTVIDSGEDKADDSEVYAGIVDFDAYRVEQLNWFKEVSKSKAFQNAKFRIVLMHIPIYYSGDWHGTTHLRDLFSDVFNEVQIDMSISGHTHRYKVKEPRIDGGFNHQYPIVIGGGPNSGKRTMIHLKADANILEISMFLDNGEIVGSYKVESKR